MVLVCVLIKGAFIAPFLLLKILVFFVYLLKDFYMKWIATLDFIHPDLDGRHKQGVVYDYEETEIVKKLAYVGDVKSVQMEEVT